MTRRWYSHAPVALGGSRRHARRLASLVGALALALGFLAAAQGALRAGVALRAKVLQPLCVVSGNTCTVRMPMSSADNNTDVVIKDPLHDSVAWNEYLEAVVKEREGWHDLYRACRDLTVSTG